MSADRYLLLPDDFRPEQGHVYGGLEGLVDCEPYLNHGGHADMRWCEFSRIALGSASIYPVKLQIPERGEGQFKFEEVEGWRYNRFTLEALQDLDRSRGISPQLEDRSKSSLPPGIDPMWLGRQLRP